VIAITLPAGSALFTATPAVCSVSEPVTSFDPLVVSCERDNIAAGATVSQQLLVQVPAVAVATEAVVSAVLSANERASDPDSSHADTFPAPDQALTMVPTETDAAGGCLRDSDAALATRAGLSSANPLITTAGLTGAAGVVCVPVTVVERRRTNPTEACGEGATCTTDIAVTEFIPVIPPPSSPLQLTFTAVASNKNLTWYKNGDPVAECPGASGLPADLNACVNSRSKAGSTSVRLGVLWRAGPDPSWTG
jgi:hypothetical protein